IKTYGGGIYITTSDFDAMPLSYFGTVAGARGIIIGQTLAFPWGIRAFTEEYGDAAMEPGNPGRNIKKALLFLGIGRDLYGGFSVDDAEKMVIPHAQAGITIKAFGMLQPDYFRMYSYRGVYNAGYRKDTDNFALISNYSGALSNYGVELLAAHRKKDAISAFKRTLLLPYNGSREGMEHNLKVAIKFNQ
ncbi:MAG TPA: hypothetical protein P5511_04730, partial [Candidatus Goldiibacteriota bacterium]|nr:hypothetical protein [Candidatus Goldiibacteriota bacterium]